MIQAHVVKRFQVEWHLFALLDVVPNMTTICRQQHVDQEQCLRTVCDHSLMAPRAFLFHIPIVWAVYHE